MTIDPEPPEISHAAGSLAWGTDGRCFTDLTIGFGAVFLGHGHPQVTLRLQNQLTRLWHSGGCPTPSATEAELRIHEFLPTGFKPGGLYSTGMEVAEFAMRLAAHHTGRPDFAGFAHSMHGKSAMTAALCWDNAPIRTDHAHILQFVDQIPESDVLDQLSRRLKTGRIAALFVEPIQGSNGGYEASTDFYRRVIEMCRESGTYCVFDEILTGLYRTGSAFYVDRLAIKPDFLLFGKSMANGFPVSSLAIPEDMVVVPQTRPGSTFSGNPLAAAAVTATLEVMRELPMADQVAGIEETVRDVLGGREADGFTLRGCGALWMLEIESQARIKRVQAAIWESGVLVSTQGRFIRILPASTIDLGGLREACGKIADACVSMHA
jgi:acetylornithine/succinyldiaminopimelate/putrescine aminotransferase